MAVELASAYVTLVPSARGMQAAIATEMGGPAQAAGTQAGRSFGTNFAKAGALAGAAVIGKGVFDFTSFERGLNEVFTLIPDAGQETFDELTRQTKDFSKEFGVLPDQIIPSLYDSLSAGVPPGNVFDFLEDANKLAKGGATDLGTAVDGLTSTLNAYGLGADDTTRVSDALFTAVKLGKTTVDELSSSMFQVAPIAASVGVPIEQVSAAFATLTAQGTPTRQAATQMRGAIAELAKDGTKSSTAFNEAFGQTFKEFIAGGGTLQEAAAGMQTAAKDSGVELLDLFGSVEGAQAFVGLASDVEGAESTLKAVQDSAGATQTAFEQMEEGIGPKMDKLKARFSLVALELGTSLAPAIETVAGVALKLIEGFNSLPQPVQNAIVFFATASAVVLAFAGPAAKMIKAIGLVSKAFTLLAANPWVLVIIAAVALAFVIIKYWDEISAALVAAWDWVAAKATEIWNAIKDFFVQWWPLLLGIMTGGVGLIVALIIQNWDAIWGKTTEVWNAITGFLSGVLSGIAGLFDTLVIQPIDKIIGLFEALPGVASAAWNGVKAAVEAVVDAIVAAIDRVRQAAKDALGPVGDLVSTAGNIGSGALGLLGFDSGGVVPGPKGAPRLALVHGGETIFPTHKTPLAQLAPIGATSMRPTQVYNDFRGLTVRDDSDLKAITRAVDRVKASQGSGNPNGGLNW